MEALSRARLLSGFEHLTPWTLEGYLSGRLTSRPTWTEQAKCRWYRPIITWIIGFKCELSLGWQRNYARLFYCWSVESLDEQPGDHHVVTCRTDATTSRQSDVTRLRVRFSDTQQDFRVSGRQRRGRYSHRSITDRMSLTTYLLLYDSKQFTYLIRLVI